MDSAYLDSSIFLAIFNGEPSGQDIKALFRELRRDNCKMCTSILTIQEVSVASYLFGGSHSDNYAKVDRIARIHGVTRDIALTAARLEAAILERMKRMSKSEKQTMSPRRKLDCLHIATATELKCRWIYSLDPGMIKCKELLPSGMSITFTAPRPSRPELFAGTKGVPIQ
jgi:predicted nucleic acid-binding protein